MKKTKIKHRLVSSIFSKIPISILVRLAGTGVLVAYYHMISDDDKLHIKHLYAHKNITMFRKDIDFLAGNFSPISLTDLLGFLKSGISLPRQSFLLTFDDGFREMHDIVAPILIEKGIPATFFVNSAFIDNKQLCHHHKASLLVEYFQKMRSSSVEIKVQDFLKDNEVKYEDVSSALLSISYQKKELLDEIADLTGVNFLEYLTKEKPYLCCNEIKYLVTKGFTIGGHSIDHPFYSTLSVEDQLRQTIESVQFVRERFHLSYGAFAFPQSDHNVSKEFFSRLKNSALVDLSFGTAGLMDDTVTNNLQRFSLENPVVPAEKIVAYQLARRLQKLVARDAKIDRK